VKRKSISKKDYWLRFNGVDYKAKVWLNNALLGAHTGYFQPFEFRITDKLKPGENIIKIAIDPGLENIKDWPENKHSIKGVFGHHDIRPGSWHPKYGQDRNTGGIWNNIELIETKGPRIKNIWITPTLNKNYSKASIDIKIQIGRKIIRQKLIINHPRLWWTWDQGVPYLYILKIANLKIPFGIREIKTDKAQNTYLNGRRIFIRGSNIIPEEYLSKYTVKRIEKDIQLARNANINALRLHAHINRREFYSACDKAGFLVWQDFPLQWEYTNSPSFIKEAKRQIKDMVNLLYNHASIFVWCCHNEPIKSAKKIDPILVKTVKEIDKSRIIIPNSNFREHPYPGWFTGKMEAFASLPGKPMPTEFGAQALPRLSTLKKIFSKKDLWPPNWDKWSYHNFVYEQTFHIAGIKKGKSIKEFIKNSQDYQAKLLKFAIEHYRAAKFTQISGIFQFLLTDPWLCISYSVLDYLRRPKKGYWILKEAYQPVLVIYQPERDIFTCGDKLRGMFYIVNDYPYGFKNAELKIKLGNHSYPPKKIDIPPNCCINANKLVYPLPLSNRLKPGRYKLTLSLFKKDKPISKNTYTVKLNRIPKGLLKYNAVFNF